MKQIFLCVLVAIGSVVQAQDNRLPLRKAVEIAITNNLTTKQSDLQVSTAEAALRQTKANLLPDLFGNLSHGINQGRSIDPFSNSYLNQQVNYANYSLSTGVTLFRGGLLRNTVKQYNLTYQATKEELQQAKDNITLNVILAYLQILNNEDQLKQSQNQAAVTSSQVKRLEILHADGAIAPALLYDLKGQLANDELAIISAQNTLDAARLTLSQLMNVPFEKNLLVEQLPADQFSPYEGTPDQIFEIAAQQLASIKAPRLRQLAAERAVKASRGYFYPTVGLNGNLFTNYSSAASKDIIMGTSLVPSGDYIELSGNKVPVVTSRSLVNSEKIAYVNQFKNNYSTSVSLGINIPILNAFRARYQVSLAKIDLKNAEYIYENSRIQLKQLVEQAFFNMSAANKRYTTLVQQVKDFTESFRVAEVKFNAGASTQVDYLIAKNNVDRANINLIIARYDFMLRSKVLDYYQGKLML